MKYYCKCYSHIKLVTLLYKNPNQIMLKTPIKASYICTSDRTHIYIVQIVFTFLGLFIAEDQLIILL